MGALTTLGPRLRTVNGTQRLKMLLADLLLLAALAALAGVFLFLIGQYFCEWVMPDQVFTRGLIIAVVVSGFARVLVALSQGTVVAWASQGDVHLLQGLSWLSLAFSALAAWYLSQYGLAGVIYGVASGWMLKAGLTLIVTFKYLSR
jgi:hypothetical protein